MSNSELNQMLSELGYRVLKAFQNDAGLPVTGLADEATQAELRRRTAKTPNSEITTAFEPESMVAEPEPPDQSVVESVEIPARPEPESELPISPALLENVETREAAPQFFLERIPAYHGSGDILSVLPARNVGGVADAVVEMSTIAAAEPPSPRQTDAVEILSAPVDRTPSIPRKARAANKQPIQEKTPPIEPEDDIPVIEPPEEPLPTHFRHTVPIVNQKVAQSSSSRGLLREGDRGPLVIELQTMLKDIGLYSGAIDGVFTEDLVNSVRKLQHQFNLNIDGIAGKSTWEALDEAFEAVHPEFEDFRPTLRSGDQGPAVAELQKDLISLGFYRAGADGDFGPGTEQAVRDFQAAHGLADDGIAGFLTYAIIDKVLEEMDD